MARLGRFLMNRIFTLAIALLATSGIAHADAPKAKGAYIGGSVGGAVFDDDGALGVFYDDTDTSLHIYAGYKFFRYLSVEGRYADLGSFSDGFDTLDITAVSAHVVGIIPFGTSGWEIFGHLGLAEVRQKVAGFYNASDSAGSAGMGVRWHINQSIAVAAQIDAYAWQNDEIGSLYDLSVGTTQLTFQFNF